MSETEPPGSTPPEVLPGLGTPREGGLAGGGQGHRGPRPTPADAAIMEDGAAAETQGRAHRRLSREVLRQRRVPGSWDPTRPVPRPQRGLWRLQGK